MPGGWCVVSVLDCIATPNLLLCTLYDQQPFEHSNVFDDASKQFAGEAILPPVEDVVDGRSLALAQKQRNAARDRDALQTPIMRAGVNDSN